METLVGLYKVVVVGDADVGKTFLISQYTRSELPSDPHHTIGVEFAKKTMHLEAGGKVKAHIWDLAGQERYRHITTAHYRRALGALLVYDITQEKTFQNINRWAEELRAHAEPDIVIMLVGNKSDLVEESPEKREVLLETAQQMASASGMLFIETSAVNGVKVNEAFELLLKEINRRKSTESSKRSIANGKRLQAVEHTKETSWCCC